MSEEFEAYKKRRKEEWLSMLHGCERDLHKAIFPEKMSKEFYESRFFKEYGLEATRLGDFDYFMWIEIRLNSYKYNLEYATERIKKLDELTEEQWRSDTRHLFRQIQHSEFENRQYKVGDRFHDFKM